MWLIIWHAFCIELLCLFIKSFESLFSVDVAWQALLIRKGNVFMKNRKKKSHNQRQRKKLHDLLFKSVYSQPAFCSDIFKLTLTPQQYNLFDWNTLTFEINTFVDPEWREKRSDLLCSVKTKDRKAQARIIFLLEAKSKYDKQWITQLLHYQAGIYSQSTAPVVIVLFYTGKQKEWPYPLSFHEHLQFPLKLKKHFTKNILNFHVRLLNVRKLGLRSLKRKDLRSGVIMYIMSNIWEIDEEKLRVFFKLSHGVRAEDRVRLVERAVDYVRQWDPGFKWNIIQKIEEQTLTKQEDRTMALLPNTEEKLIAKGIRKGRLEGRQEVILNMLKKKTDITFISEVTGLSEKEIKKFKNKLLKSRTIKA